MLSVGSKAPDFALKGSDGNMYSLKDFSAKYIVLYFYPKDDTPGCTIEAKGFSSQKDEFAGLDIDVVGVSSDDYNSHCRFVQKYGLNLLLLSDPGSEAIKSYEAYANRGIFGWGTVRKTFVLGKERNIIMIYPKVNPEGHEKEILEFIKKQKD